MCNFGDTCKHMLISLWCSASPFATLDLNDDLFDVKRELISVAGNWKNIGIALRLKRTQLEHIQTVNDGDPNACLTSVVMEWLNRKYNVKRFGEPTWQFLVEALGDPAVGVSMELASNIARRHKAKNGLNKATASKNLRKRKAESGPNIPARKKVNVKCKPSCHACLQ